MNGEDFRRGDEPPARAIDAPQTEAFRQKRDAAVGRSIAHDDDLELRVVELEEVTDRGADDRGFVVAGDDQRDGHGQARFPDPPELREADPLAVASRLE